MTIEAATYIDTLDDTYPAGTDAKKEGDNHIRLLKTVLQATFPNIDGAVTATPSNLNKVQYLANVTADLTTSLHAPAGTKAIFAQTAAPTGWTKDTTHNDKALRVVTGTASSGGSVAFTTAFASSGVTDSHTLTTDEIPVHSHGVTDPGHVHTKAGSFAILSIGNAYSVLFNSGSTSTNSNTTGITINNAGGGSGHTHTLGTLEVQYVDVIIATKD